MPTPGESQSAPSLARRRPLLAGAGDLAFPREQLPWTFMVHPLRMHCRDGHIVPLPGKAWWVPGLQGNSPARLDQGQQGQGAIAGMATQGWVPVPHDLQGLVAFGQSRDNAPDSTYLDIYRRPNGSILYASECWSAPTQYGGRLIFEYDAEGYLKFLLKIRELVAPGAKLAKVQIEAAIGPVVAEVRRLMDRDDKRARRMVAERIRHLPREHCPADLVELLPAAEPRKGKAPKTDPAE